MTGPTIPAALVHDDDHLTLAPRRPAAVRCMNGLVARLQASIAVYADERRVAGASLDRVLAEVRALVHDAERAEGWPDELGVLAGRVARWATEAYLDEPGLRNVPRFY